MLIDRLRQISKSYTVYVPSTYTDIFGTGTYRNGALDNNLMVYNLNEVIKGTLWTDIAVNYISNENNGDAVFAIKSDGTLWSWGYQVGTLPQLGNNTTVNKSSPSQIGSDTNWKNVFAGSDGHAFAIKTNNTLWAWGNNDSGQLGDGTTADKSSPVQIGALTDWSKVSLGLSYTMAIKTNGTLWGWGSNIYGELGNGESRYTYKNFDNQSNWSKVASGDSYTMAIKTDGTLWGWGFNNSGKIGNNSTVLTSLTVQIGTDTNWSMVSVNRSTTMAIRTNGTLWGWGEGAAFRKGDNTQTDRSAPVQIGADTNWSTVSIGLDFGHAIKTTGTLWAWGQNNMGQLGDNTTTARSNPVQIGALTDWKDVHNGLSHTVAIRTDGTLYSWGQNMFGQLGNNSSASTSSPNQIGTDTDWDKIAVGDEHAIALKTNGTLWVWGRNNLGQLGDTTNVNRSSPVQIGFDTDWSSVNCGGSASAAIKTDGTLWVWGNSIFGNSSMNGTFLSPVMITDVSTTWSQVSLGTTHIFAIDTSNNLYTPPVSNIIASSPSIFLFKSSPVQIGNESNWKDIFCGDRISYGIKTDNSLWNWGYDVRTNSNNLLVSTTLFDSNYNWKTLDVSLDSSLRSVSAIKTNGTLWSWGDNTYGQLGDNTSTRKSSPVQIGFNTDWDSIYSSRGGNFKASIKTDGTLWGWGRNDYFMLFDGTSLNRSSPVQIGNIMWEKMATKGNTIFAGISSNNTLHTAGKESYNLGNFPLRYSSPQQIGNTLSNLKSISVKWLNGSYIKSDGTLWTWGDNTYGQLGNNITKPQPSPNQIGSSTDWSKVFVGYYYTMAIKTNNSLWGWGLNTSNHLGDGTFVSKSSPVQITGITDVLTVSTANDNAFAIKTDGTLWSWGMNSFGQLGNNTLNNRSTPQQIGVETSWSKVSIHSHTLAIRTNGTLWAWGYNFSGQLGDETTVNRSSPVQIGTDTDWDSVLACEQYSLALKTDNTLWVWGLYTLGNLGTAYERATFLKLPKTISASMITTNSGAAIVVGTVFVIDVNNKLWGWGENSQYQLGIPNNDQIDARLIHSDSSWSKIASGLSHTIAIKTGGTLWGWGSGANGRIGDGTTTQRQSPVQIGAGTDWSEVAAGNAASHAIKAGGTLWGWGSNTSGEIGDGTVISRSAPVQIGSLTDWSKISDGNTFSIALKTNGTLWGWGTNGSGNLGDGSTINRSSPVQIGALTDWSFISAGSNHTMAIKTNGTLWGWGLNGSGRLGDGTIVNRSSPVQIGALTDWSKVSAGGTHTLAVKTNGTLWFMGANTNYQGGDNSLNVSTTRSSPTQVGTDTDWIDVACGISYSIALKSNGTIYTTGGNNVLGGGYNGVVSRSSPIQLGYTSDWESLPLSSAQDYHVIVKKTDGTIWGWGANTGTQLGDGTTTSKSSPVQISSATDTDQMFVGWSMSVFTRSQTY